ncbi:MAG: hypothetical protein IKE95_07085 [Methanobrevibacter sp.]|nr:hypothetical protein [Methanobrevibacter sp.]
MSNLKELINEYIELEEQYDEENEELAEKLDELGHEIDHAVYHEEFLIVFNKSDDEEKIVTMLMDEGDEYFIPVYTDDEEAAKAIEFFKEESGEVEFLTEKAIGNELNQTYADDDEFLGLAINAPENGFIIPSVNVHDCSE